MFDKGDVALWKVAEENLEQAKASKTDPVTAYRMMLPKETQELDAKREEYEYFMNCCNKEMKRVTGLNYQMGRELLVDAAE